jgi:hypothetical protein
MLSITQKPIIFALSFPALGAFAACSAATFMGEAASIFVEDMSNEYSRQEFIAPNHYDPIISFANDRFIRVKYLDNDDNAQPDLAMSLIRDHCDDSFKETSRRTSHGGVTTVEAECT